MLRITSVTALVCVFAFIGTCAAFYEDKPEGGIFQYQSSFHGPYGGTHIPFWEVGGSAIIADTYVRLTPNEQSQKGYIWSTRPLRSTEWQVQLAVAVGGPNRIGADGMALWYTKERTLSGSIYGGPETWEGLGIFFDTFDNDGKRDNPVIYAVYNDGSLKFDAGSDGKSNALGSCIAQIRQVTANPEQKWIKIRIKYTSGELYIAYDQTEVNGGVSGYIDCFRARVDIPNNAGANTAYYLGLTAETGGLSDFHDVKYLTTWSFRNNFQQKQPVVDVQPPQQQEQAQEEAQEKAPEQVQDPIVQPLQQEPVRAWTGGDPVPEVLNRLQQLDQKEQQILSTVDSKVRSIEEKLVSFERAQNDLISKLQTSIEQMTQKLAQASTQELQHDLRSVTANINNLQNRINSLQSLVEGTNRKTSDLHRLQETKSEELSSLLEKSSSWGFWTFFVIFQIFFGVAFVMWKKAHDEKNRKMF